MSKTLLIAMMVLLAVGPLCAGTLTVVWPNGGDKITLGRPNCQVKWTAAGVTQNIRINLLKNGAVVGTIAASLPANSSPFLWKAGQLTDGTTVQSGCDYKVRIRAIDGSEVDESDDVFSLVAPAPPPPAISLEVVSPNGGESWVLGSEHAISWNSTNLTGKVQLQLYRHPCCFVGVIEENLPSTGSFTWKAGKYQGNIAPAGKYNIRVCSMTDHKIFDVSDAPFTIQRLKMDAKKPVPQFLKPDLVVCANAVVYTPLNTPGTFHVHVRNIGKGTAKAPFAVKILLSLNETRLVTVEADLAPGETRWVCDYSASSSHAVGLGFAAVVDSDDAITEANEQNNTLHGSLQVGASNPVAYTVTCSDGSPM